MGGKCSFFSQNSCFGCVHVLRIGEIDIDACTRQTIISNRIFNFTEGEPKLRKTSKSLMGANDGADVFEIVRSHVYFEQKVSPAVGLSNDVLHLPVLVPTINECGQLVLYIELSNYQICINYSYILFVDLSFT